MKFSYLHGPGLDFVLFIITYDNFFPLLKHVGPYEHWGLAFIGLKCYFKSE